MEHVSAKLDGTDTVLMCQAQVSTKFDGADLFTVCQGTGQCKACSADMVILCQWTGRCKAWWCRHGHCASGNRSVQGLVVQTWLLCVSERVSARLDDADTVVLCQWTGRCKAWWCRRGRCVSGNRSVQGLVVQTWLLCVSERVSARLDDADTVVLCQWTGRCKAWWCRHGYCVSVNGSVQGLMMQTLSFCVSEQVGARLGGADVVVVCQGTGQCMAW